MQRVVFRVQVFPERDVTSWWRRGRGRGGRLVRRNTVPTAAGAASRRRMWGERRERGKQTLQSREPCERGTQNLVRFRFSNRPFQNVGCVCMTKVVCMKIKSLISSYSIYIVCEKLAVVCIWHFLCVLEFQVERSSVTFADIGGCQTAIEVCHYVIMMSLISSLCSVLCPRFSLSGGPETSPPHEAPGGVFSSRDLPPTGGSPPRTPRLREDIASLRHCWG